MHCLPTYHLGACTVLLVLLAWPAGARSVESAQAQNYDADTALKHSQAAIGNLFAVRKTQVALVLGDMFELGDQSESLHAALGDFIKDFQPAMTIGVGPMMEAAVDRVHSPKAWFSDVDAAKAELPRLLQEMEWVLIKGSRGMALERLVEVI